MLHPSRRGPSLLVRFAPHHLRNSVLIAFGPKVEGNRPLRVLSFWEGELCAYSLRAPYRMPLTPELCAYSLWAGARLRDYHVPRSQTCSCESRCSAAQLPPSYPPYPCYPLMRAFGPTRGLCVGTVVTASRVMSLAQMSFVSLLIEKQTGQHGLNTPSKSAKF